MHGLWNNFKSSVGETLDNIILSPKKLRKKFGEKKQDSTYSEKSNSFDKEFPETSSKTTPMAEGLAFTSGLEKSPEKTENISQQIPTIININNQSIKDDGIIKKDTSHSQRSNGSAAEQPSISSQSRIDNTAEQNIQPISCHNIGDSNKSEKSSSRLNETMDLRKGGDTISAVSQIALLKSKPAAPRRTNTLGVIDIELINDIGENESVEIDIADFESSKEEDKNLYNTRRQSISDRINRRRTSELAAEIIRLSAEHRKKEFSDLLDEHEEIVQNIEIWKKTGVLPPSRCPKSRSNLETVDDDEISDDIIDEEPHYFRQINDNSSTFHSQQDNKENKTLPRSH